MSCSIVCCLDYTPEDSIWITNKLADTGARFIFAKCAPKNKLERNLKLLNLGRIRGGYEAAILAKKSQAAAIISIGPAAAAWCAIFCMLLGAHAKIIAHAFNFPSLPTGLKRVFFSFALRRVSRFVVFSTIEKSIYSSTFNVPLKRFDFIFCDADPRRIDQHKSPYIEGSYISAIGGNARDFGVLMAAARTLPELRFVLVVRPDNLQGFSVPENVHVHIDLPFEIAMNVLLHSKFMILPLLGSSVPCGHVTLACAMHLGKAIAITGSSGIADYVRDGVTGVTFPSGDSTALAIAIRRLSDDPSFCERLGNAARQFASDMCSEDRTVSYFRRLCADLI
jgi:glycosyltransferase involved in cell wall biosynthesis